jgi:phosphate transport system substrate-binding protein
VGKGPGGILAGGSRVKRTAVLTVFLAFLVAGCGQHPARELNGTGSTFIAPLMSEWAGEYEKARGTRVTYESVGSGVGTQRWTSGVFDFACTDAPLTEEQLAAARHNGGEVVHIPLILGAVVPAYNLEGVTEPLTFTGPVLADIFLGKVKTWNDPALKELNPRVLLPDQEIAVVHRADGSGTTSIWTDYLARVSPEWQSKVGAGTSVTWPTGEGQMGNESVAKRIKDVAGSLGYVPLNYALAKDIKFGLVKNQSGVAVRASAASVTAAADARLADIPDDLRYSLTDAPGKDSYPISGTTWAVLHVNQPAGRGQALVDFLRWVTHDGQGSAEQLHFARLPGGLVERLDKKLAQVNGGK